MEINVKIDKIVENENSKILAICSLSLDDNFVVKGLRIVNGKNGAFLSMPSSQYTTADGETKYSDHFYATNDNAREVLTRAAFDQYELATGKRLTEGTHRDFTEAEEELLI